MRISADMKRLLRKQRFKTALDESLTSLALKGFCRKRDCYLFNALISFSGIAKRKNFVDCTGFECFINSVRADADTIKDSLEQGLLFVVAAFGIWNNGSNKLLNAIISLDDRGAVMRFHVKRHDENWIGGNLDNLMQPVMLIDSSEDVLQTIRSQQVDW
jgi:hypothetical protein